MTRLLAEMTWPEVAALDKRVGAVVLPLGSLEQHGPHLTVDCDLHFSARFLDLALDGLAEDVPIWRLPMLPITHGMQYTGLQVWLYTIALAATTLLPFAVGMSGLIYLGSAAVLGAIFLWYAWRMWKHYSDLLARQTFAYSIVYLSLLFAALLVDHYIKL